MNPLPTTGITTTLVADTLGTSSRDVGTLCTSDNINMFSKYKPMSIAKVSDVDDNDREFINWGVTVPEPIGYPIQNGELTHNPWVYNKPTGGANSPYRLGDFRKYKHDAVSPIQVVFPDKLEMAGNRSGGGIWNSGFDVFFQNRINEFDPEYNLALDPALHYGDLSKYYLTLMVQGHNDNGEVMSYYIFDIMSVQDRISDIATAGEYFLLNFNYVPWAEPGMTVTCMMAMSGRKRDADSINGTTDLGTSMWASLETTYGSDRKDFVIEYVSPVEGVTCEIMFELNAYQNTSYVYVSSLSVKVTKDPDTFRPLGQYYLQVEGAPAALANDQTCIFQEYFSPDFTGNEYTYTFNVGSYQPEDNHWTVDPNWHDIFNMYVYYQDDETRSVWLASKDINNED